ncbi:MAG: ATP:cob(I)alamin adenosyltransferase [Anaerolineales bacterium]|nr:ATP:cob(I)alamin adenosyltransferase [Anaerolineales bacterium]
MSELAALSDDRRPESRITPDQLEALERACYEYTSAYPPVGAFVVPDDSTVGAMLHGARAIIRRAERHVTQLDQEAPLPNPHIISYLQTGHKIVENHKPPRWDKMACAR